MARRTAPCAAAAVALLSLALLAHVRLIHSGNGNPLYWSDPAHVEVVISSRGSDDIPGAGHRTAIRGSIDAWNRSQGTTAHLTEDTSAAQRARTDWEADDLHLVWFDESGASGFFPSGSGIVAITPVWFKSDGRITDADVLFNGRGFHFTADGASGAFDVEDVATHELGHLLGLDHSGSSAASLFPYVSPGMTVHRSISSDDEHGLRQAYPSGSAGSISGTVRRAASSSAVAGALVVARSSTGRNVTSVLASSSGHFKLGGLAPDDYTVYATPLDFPVSKANLAPGHAVQTNFRSTVHGIVSVGPAQQVAIGSLLVGSDVAVALGRNYDPLPLSAVRGASTVLALHGAGLVPGSILTCSDPLIAVAPLSWNVSQVVFRVTVPAGAAPGHADLWAIDPQGALSILPGALEIVPADPVIATILPDRSTDAGGTTVTISGANFRSGLRLVVGDRIYRDGAQGGCTVVDDQTVTFTTAPTDGGCYDVVAIDATGVEGRAPAAFTFQTVPGIVSIFPTAGASAGGTVVTVVGSGFVQGSTVSIDGVAQPSAVVVDDGKIRFTTEPGAPGGPWVVEVLNPGGAVATAAFAFSALEDPSLAVVSPAVAPSSGGALVTLHGSGFTPSTEVHFGADPADGGGGVGASSVRFVDAATLEVRVPAHASGVVSVMVSEASSGQASVLPLAFTYRDDGGGDGSCIAAAGTAGSSLLDALAASWWIGAAALAALWTARPRSSASPARRAFAPG